MPFLFKKHVTSLDDVSCLVHLSIRGRLLDHDKIDRDETLEMLVDYLRVDSKKAMKKLEVT